jgi:hypothetical protein
VLGIDAQTGSLEPGKMADVVVWSQDPFSVYSKVERVYVDGLELYEADGTGRRESDFELGQGAELPRRDATPARARHKPSAPAASGDGGSVSPPGEGDAPSNNLPAPNPAHPGSEGPSGVTPGGVAPSNSPPAGAAPSNPPPAPAPASPAQPAPPPQTPPGKASKTSEVKP